MVSRGRRRSEEESHSFKIVNAVCSYLTIFFERPNKSDERKSIDKNRI